VQGNMQLSLTVLLSTNQKRIRWLLWSMWHHHSGCEAGTLWCVVAALKPSSFPPILTNIARSSILLQHCQLSLLIYHPHYTTRWARFYHSCFQPADSMASGFELHKNTIKWLYTDGGMSLEQVKGEMESVHKFHAR
jgi:hypothetical protein